MIDLHVHSIFSDGSYTPEQLIDMAKEAGLKAVALTDHDTVDGLKRFAVAAEKNGVIGVPGVEISADVSSGTLHMLGYYVDDRDPNLQRFLKEIRDGRKERNDYIVTALNKLGFDITIEEVASYAGDDFVGRPHFALALEAKGYVSNKNEAFDKYLGRGKPAYVERLRLSPEESIKMIRGAGGIAILAHPFTLALKHNKLVDFCTELKEAGLEGIEVFYPEHNKGQLENYLAIAKELDLVATGGTDFHGAVTPNLKLGRGYGDLRVDDSILEQIENLLKKRN